MASKRFNVLCLDGGGVRGLSSLLVLEALMDIVNVEWTRQYRGAKALSPGELFDLIVGTSTGGLIALMFVKLNMNISDAIKQYENLSEKIFSHNSRVGKWTVGQAKPRFDSDVLEKVLRDEVIVPRTKSAEHKIEDIAKHEHSACAVVCREVTEEGQRKRDEIFLCSHRDNTQIDDDTQIHDRCHHRCRLKQKWHREEHVEVLHAAIATCAAPTYFEPQSILDKWLVDGGYGETNNPSGATYKHYFRKTDFQQLVFVNIGTGSEPQEAEITASEDPENTDAAQEGSISGWTWLKQTLLYPIHKTQRVWTGTKQSIKRPIKRFHHMKTDVLNRVTDCEPAAETMKLIAEVSNQIEYMRYSVDKSNMHEIDLAAWCRLEDIRNATRQYLADPGVILALQNTAAQLLTVFVAKSRNHAASTVQSLNGPVSRPTYPQDAVRREDEFHPSEDVADNALRPGTSDLQPLLVLRHVRSNERDKSRSPTTWRSQRSSRSYSTGCDSPDDSN